MNPEVKITKDEAGKTYTFSIGCAPYVIATGDIDEGLAQEMIDEWLDAPSVKVLLDYIELANIAHRVVASKRQIAEFASM